MGRKIVLLYQFCTKWNRIYADLQRFIEYEIKNAIWHIGCIAFFVIEIIHHQKMMQSVSLVF